MTRHASATKVWEEMRESTRHPHNALTARTVTALSAPGRYADGHGLYLLIGPGGAKSWMLRVTVKNGKREDVGLGGVRDVTLEKAREAARQWRAEAKAGRSPVAVKRGQHALAKAKRQVPTFEQAARACHVLQAHAFRSDKHRRQWLSSLGTIFLAFGATPVDEVHSNDVVTALESHWLSKPETARRILGRVRAVFEWARAKQFCVGDNPAHALEKIFPKKSRILKHHGALPYAELPAFIQELRTSNAGLAVQLAFEFLILTGARTSEVLNAPWSEFDTQAGRWTIPGGRMKAGTEHRVPLSPRCLEILRQAASIREGGTFAFPGARPGRPLSSMCFLMTLRRMNRTSITAHGFRSCFRDWTEEQTHTPRAVAEAALAHANRDRVEAAYRRSDLFDKRCELMNAWATFATTLSGAHSGTVLKRLA